MHVKFVLPEEIKLIDSHAEFKSRVQCLIDLKDRQQEAEHYLRYLTLLSSTMVHNVI